MSGSTDQLIGRVAEQATLDAALASAEAGSGGCLLISGEPGIGKTRMVTEVLDRSRLRELPVLQGRAVPDEGAPALWPWRQALRGRPELAALADLPDAADTVGAVGAVGAGPVVARGAQLVAFDALLGQLQVAAGDRALVVVLEDLHWADESTLRLLCQAAGRPGLLLVCTYRSTEQPASLRDAATELRRIPGTSVLALRPWQAVEVAEVIAGTAHPSWASVLHRAGGGNPLVVQELLAALVDAGRAAGPAPADGAWPLGVPEHIAAITMDRLERLPADARLAVTACSVLGDAGDAESVAIVSGMTLDEAMGGLERAVKAGLLVPRAPSPLRVAFGHVLVRDAVYAAVPASERLAWHRAAAEAIEDGRLAGEPVTHRLRSATDAASRRLAVSACSEAARAASAQLAFDRAGELLGLALALSGLDDELRCELLLDAAEAEYRAGRLEQAVRHCREASRLTESAQALVRAALTVRGISGPQSPALLALCDRALVALRAADSADRDIRTVRETDAAMARVLAQRSIALADNFTHVDIETDSTESLRRAERSGDPLALSDALRARQNVVSGPAGVTERLELAGRMITLAGAGGPPDAELWGRLWRTDCAIQLGSYGVLDDEIAHLGLLADQLGWPVAHWHLHRLRTARALCTGRFAEAEAALDSARAAAQRTGDLGLITILSVIHHELRYLRGDTSELVDELCAAIRFVDLPIAWACSASYLLRLGHLDLGREGYERVRPVLTELPRDGRWWPTVVAAGQLAVGLDDLEVAQWCYEAMLPFSGYMVGGGSGALLSIGSASSSLGPLAAALGDHAGAERHLVEAIAVEDRLGLLPYRTMSEVSLAGLLIERGDPPSLVRAAEAARRAAATARRLGMAPTLARADELLAAVRSAQQNAVPLTPRERDILTRLATGRSNREMADDLVLSERTVESHVASVLAKLGVANRSQAAAWAVANGFAAVR